MIASPVVRPKPLAGAALVVALQGAVLFGYAVLELLHLSSDRVTMGVSTAVFFVGYGAALLVCAWGLWTLQSWARSPVVLTQLIQLGLAWNFRGGDTVPVAVLLAVLAVAVLVGLFHPASLTALGDAPEPD